MLVFNCLSWFHLHPLFLPGTTTSQASQPAVDPQSIAKQQADLQAKILSILNPGGGAKPASTISNTSPHSQQTVLSGKTLGGVTAPAVSTLTKQTALSTTAKPIFPLYPAQPKQSASSATGGFMSTSGVAATTARVPASASASRPVSSTAANQVGKAYQSASPYGSKDASLAAKQAASYQFTKPTTPQSTYTVGSKPATVGAPSSSVYGSQAARPSQNYSMGTQAQSGKLGQPQPSAATAVTRSPIPVVSKFSPSGQAIGTVGATRPAINAAQNIGRGTPTSVGGPRPASSIIGGQVRTPSPGLAKGRAGLLGASPASGIANRAQAVRPPSGGPGVRMGAPRGPSPVGRGTVRTPSPVGIQGQGALARGGTVSARGRAISVRGGGTGATSGAGAIRPSLTSPGGTALHTASSTRGALAQRGAPTARGIPSRGGPAGAARGTPPSRGGPTPRGAPGPRGSPIPRGSPYMRGAPGGRGAPSSQGAPIRPVVRGGPSGQGGAINRGAPRGRSMMRGGPSFRGGRGNPSGYGGY